MKGGIAKNSKYLVAVFCLLKGEKQHHALLGFSFRNKPFTFYTANANGSGRTKQTTCLPIRYSWNSIRYSVRKVLTPDFAIEGVEAGLGVFWMMLAQTQALSQSSAVIVKIIPLINDVYIL